ncbi:MAG: prolyl oligopeptidase family serine peptidase [Peptostreptococcales bacterium]
MKDHLYTNHIIEEKMNIGGIPTLLLRPKDAKEPMPTLLFYHGWSSNKESQRMRGFIYAAVGYQVFLPDAIYHGERNPIDYIPENGQYFWEAILKNMEESKLLTERIIQEFHGDPHKLFIGGSSMGGFTAAGVFTHNPQIKALVVFNGSCAWRKSNVLLMKDNDLELKTKEKKTLERALELDPMNHLEKLKDRDILMIHGDADSSVSIESQRLFFRKMQALNKDKGRVKLIEYPNLNHYITTNMMEDSIVWLKNR